MAKNPIFSKPAKPRKKNSKVESQLTRAVKNYNARITAAIKSGRLREDQAPAKASAKVLKQRLVGLDTKTRNAQMRRMIRDLEGFTHKTSRIVKTEGGIEITEYQFKLIRKLTRQAQKEAEKAQKRKQDAEKKVKVIQGIPTETAQAWSDQTKISKPLKAKSWEKFNQRFQSLTKQALHTWHIYRENLASTIENYCYQPLVRQALSLLEKISDEELAQHHARGENFVYINWWYVDVNRDEQLSRMTIDEFRAAIFHNDT